jgi:hypothetical protein
MRILALAASLLVVPVGNAQEKKAPSGPPPTLWLASAKEQEGKVVIQMLRPGLPVPPEDPKEKPAEGLVWVDLRPVTLGDTVQAFGVDGEPAGPKAVLKALAKPKGVAVVFGSARDPLTLAPFYRELLREGTIILVVKAEDIYHAKP